MDILYPNCCGIDVHKSQLAATVIVTATETGKASSETRTFSTFTGQLQVLAAWLHESKTTHVVMESTGVYWKPVFNILEAAGFTVILVNAHDVKNVPGRKTDVKDSQWLAQLLQHGLIKGSFIPPKDIRELRDLTRQRRKLEQDKSRIVNRIQKILEDCNVKLSSVATDITGKSGWAMLQAMVNGESDPAKLAGLARGSLVKKVDTLQQSLAGCVSDHHRFMLARLMCEFEFLEQEIDQFSQRIVEKTVSFDHALALLDEIPGINRVGAEEIIAETGGSMEPFPSQGHLAAWAGVAPGNNESAGKKRSTRTRDGDKWLASTLVEAAWAAGRTKKSYFHAKYQRLSARRGRKRALVAVGHSILTAAYFILKFNVPYKDLGVDYYEKGREARIKAVLVKKLEKLGYDVTLHQPAVVAS
jgi:transposase